MVRPIVKSGPKAKPARARQRYGLYGSMYDRPLPRYDGPHWLGKPITKPPVEIGPEWIGLRIPFRTTVLK